MLAGVVQNMNRGEILVSHTCAHHCHCTVRQEDQSVVSGEREKLTTQHGHVHVHLIAPPLLYILLALVL